MIGGAVPGRCMTSNRTEQPHRTAFPCYGSAYDYYHGTIVPAQRLQYTWFYTSTSVYTSIYLIIYHVYSGA